MNPPTNLKTDTEQTQGSTHESTLSESTLFLIGSAMIASILVTVVHELGHALAVSSLSIGFDLILYPFSTSAVHWLSPVPLESLLFVTAAGPAIELLFGIVLFLLLWHFRTLRLVPLLICVPVSFLHCGGNLAVGTLFGGGSDTAVMMSLGVPAILLQVVGGLFIILGAVSMILLFPLLGITPNVSVTKLFVILFIGMNFQGFGTIAYALAFNIMEISNGIMNVILWSVIVTILTGVYVKKSQFFDRVSHTEVAILDRTTIISSLTIALVLIIFELLFFNWP